VPCHLFWHHRNAPRWLDPTMIARYVPELDRIVLKESASARPFASTATCRKAVITTRILQLVHELCVKRIHVTKRDLFYTDVKLFEVWYGFLKRDTLTA